MIYYTFSKFSSIISIKEKEKENTFASRPWTFHKLDPSE
jgi:hypothetical protein